MERSSKRIQGISMADKEIESRDRTMILFLDFTGTNEAKIKYGAS